MALKQIVTMALAGGFAMVVATAASAQNAPGPGASEFAPGHSTTNIPPGQGGVKGDTWTPPGQAMKEPATTGSGLKAKASVKSKVSTNKTKAQIKAKGSVQ